MEMEIEIEPKDQNIRKIEDVIDLQKAKGSYNPRQVAFALPSETESTVSANVAKSLETGLSDSKSKSSSKKQFKKATRQKGQVPDVVSWPSDSDITVLRMKLMDATNLKDNVSNIVTGDGLHQPDSSSMVNLATLILQSQTPSKHSVLEEYLVPLTSWEEKNAEANGSFDEKERNEEITVFRTVTQEALSFIKKKYLSSEALSSRDSGYFANRPKKCRIARFFRLYFCPCCSCLYEIERMRQTSSEV
ncbi:uncharacterized protein LOC133518139 [Cydia pomonella]|uniref:uncharacterized protein LOC133518139 n=1 Tax=Cydia pomonella TaxID=82600 RepID=UPI002ADD6701|nr:uncharacterized protein LOC133518139 [Cydia pomonella]